MAKLTKADIAKAPDLPKEEVSVPEWGGEVLLRGLSGTDKDRFLAETLRPASEKNAEKEIKYDDITARLVARCLVDDAGERLYSDEQIPELGKKSGDVLTRLFKVAQRLSGLEGEAAVKAAEKN